MKYARFWIMGALISFALMGFVVLTPPAMDRASAGPPDQSSPGNPVVCEPVLVYDVTGSTIAGPTHLHLNVYSNGNVSVARRTAFGGSDGAAAFSTITLAHVRLLLAELRAAGASQLVDDPNNVVDAPLTTVTFFSMPGPQASAHTFSYWVGAFPPYVSLQQVIDAFIQEVFPNF